MRAQRDITVLVNCIIIDYKLCMHLQGGGQKFLGTSDIISNVKELHVGHFEPTLDNHV